MSKDTIHVNGEDVVVREDTAKAFRGVNWALISVAAFILITGALLLLFLTTSGRDGSIDNPSKIQNNVSR